LIIAGVILNIELERQEVLLLFLHLTNRYETLDPPLQEISRKVEDLVYSNFTISEIAVVDGTDEGAP